MSKRKNLLKIIVTTGDVDGIGLEVAAKALHILGPQKDVQIILFRAEGAEKKYLLLLDKKWSRITVDSLEDGLQIDGPYLVDIESNLPPPTWVELSAKACLKNSVAAMATAPLSKTSIKAAGYSDLGHTDILKRVTKAKSVNMGFVGNSFSVVLATGHSSLKDVPAKITFKNIAAALKNADDLRKRLDRKQAKKPIAVLGLNPHAGEEGLIGKEELSLFPRLKAFAKKKNIPMVGPLVPDAAFLRTNWKEYSLYLALYHDQGLIPFKLVHGQDSGVHITLGVPLTRTSVDHGTAKDIFGKNIANPRSMIDSIQWAIKLARL